MPTQRKVDQVAKISELISRAEIAISTAYQGVPMAKQTELRQQLKAAGAEMMVVKNTLLRIAAEQTGKPEFAQISEEGTALVVGFDEPVSAAKALTAFIRANNDTKVAIRKAVVGGQVVNYAGNVPANVPQVVSNIWATWAFAPGWSANTWKAP